MHPSFQQALSLAAIHLACASTPAAELTATQPPEHRLLCADYGGNIEWACPAERPQDVWRLPNGNVLFSHLRGVRQITLDKKVVWEYATSPPNEVQSCQPLPDGAVLIAECGTCRLIEVDRRGQIRKQIKVATSQQVHGQMRVCRKTPGGSYLVALMGDRIVREYGGDGKVLRTIPTPGNVYAAVRLVGGNTLIACGDGHRLIEVDPQGKVVWNLGENDLPGNPLRFVAGVQRLPNGDTLVCNWGGHGHVGQQPQIFEVTRDKKVVWQVFDKRLGTISSVQAIDVPGDVTRGEILR
jgi:hypothetical protein